MRFILGLILGCALTVGGAYMADRSAEGPEARMVNWDVVSRNVDGVINMTRDGWRRITG
jgi:hypothetical protein